MKKFTFLKSLFLAAILAVGSSSAWAQDVTIWSEDWSSGSRNQTPSEVNSTLYTQTGSGTKLYAEALAGGTSPELLLAKSGGTWTVTLTDLKGAEGGATLTFKNNNNTRTTVSSSSTGITVGTRDTSVDKVTTYPITIAAGTKEMVLVFKNTATSNVRIDDVVLTGKATLPTIEAIESVTFTDVAVGAHIVAGPVHVPECTWSELQIQRKCRIGNRDHVQPRPVGFRKDRRIIEQGDERARMDRADIIVGSVFPALACGDSRYQLVS